MRINNSAEPAFDVTALPRNDSAANRASTHLSYMVSAQQRRCLLIGWPPLYSNEPSCLSTCTTHMRIGGVSSKGTESNSALKLRIPTAAAQGRLNLLGRCHDEHRFETRLGKPNSGPACMLVTEMDVRESAMMQRRVCGT
jgi:hypothetical protein